MSILDDIVARRRQDVVEAKMRESLAALQQIKPQFPVQNLHDHVMFRRGHDGRVVVMAEIKRASPSRGDICVGVDVSYQALAYAKGGSAVISVLTEPTWFKGTLDDMRSARQAVDALDERPCILRKDFIVDEYQIYEARIYGADTVLLIVAVLMDEEITNLINCARSLGMEPLVEVNCEER